MNSSIKKPPANRESFFEFRASHDCPSFRIIVALLFDIGKRRTFETASPG